jgi:hypothetical protein
MDIIKEFQKKHTEIKVEEKIWVETIEDDVGNEHQLESTTYELTAIPNLDGLTLELEKDSEFDRLDKILDSKPILFKDFLGGKVAGNVEVVLTKIYGNSHQFAWPPSKPIQISISYKSEILEIQIYLRSLNKTEIGFLADNMVGVKFERNRAIAKIMGLSAKSPEELESDTKLILRSVLFDLECTYGEGFETTNLENLKTPANKHKQLSLKFPLEKINLTYKAYIIELIEYFHTGEKVEQLPFKFICYFHIIEYFMDKSAHSVVAKKIKQIIMSPV